MRVFVLYDFDKSSPEAQHAFLKTLEEHPSNVTLILTCANQSMILPTIVSRCTVVSLDSELETPDSYKSVSRALEAYLTSHDIATIGTKVFDVKTYRDPSEFFLSVMLFFQSRLSTDPTSTYILKEALRLNSLVQNNNVSPQQAVDGLLFFIRDKASHRSLHTRRV